MKRRPGQSQHEIDDDAIMVRAYGNGTAVLIDREREARSHSLLAKHNLAPELLARFDNGLLYRYIHGDACTSEDLRRPEIASATAKLLGVWHATLPTSEAVGTPLAFERIARHLSGKPPTNLWTVMQKWITALPSDTKEERHRNAQLEAEVEYSTKLLGKTAGLNDEAYVLGHCDLLSGNVIIMPSKPQCNGHSSAVDVSFIDYEYATPVPAAFDLANHFAEWGGFDCDYSVLPTQSQRRSFIRHYVHSYRSHQQQTPKAVTTDQDVTQLMAEVDAFRGMPGLYWGIWALIQATISQIDFDYASYAQVRLAEYWEWKSERDGSRVKEGREMSLREHRLAQEQ